MDEMTTTTAPMITASARRLLEEFRPDRPGAPVRMTPFVPAWLYELVQDADEADQIRREHIAYEALMHFTMIGNDEDIDAICSEVDLFAEHMRVLARCGESADEIADLAREIYVAVLLGAAHFAHQAT